MTRRRNFYIWLLYLTLIPYCAYLFIWNTLGPTVTDVLQYSLLVLLFLGVCRYIISNPSYRYFITWSLLLVLIHAIAFIRSGNDSTTEFKEMFFVMLVAIPFMTEAYSPKAFKYAIFTMCAILILIFFYNFSLMQMENKQSYGGGYMSLVALPVGLYFLKNKNTIFHILWSFFIFVLVLLSIKRGDILACSLSILLYFFLYLQQFRNSFIRIIFVVAILLIFGIYEFNHLESTSDTFAWRVEQTREGDLTNRDIIYGEIWRHFLQAPLDEQIFGSGFDATLRIAGARAHSDWLEILADEGLLGCVIYLGTMISFIINIKKRSDITEKTVLAIILMIWVVKSLVSMFIYSQPSIILFLLTGFILNNRIEK